MKQFYARIYCILSVSLILLSLLPACKKSATVDPIPTVPVNLTVPLSLPEYSALNSIGNHVYINGGYKGIILYRNLSGFLAFERACPYDPTTSGSIIEVDSGGVTTVDRHCGSKFSMDNGGVIKGPATRAMKQYNVNFDQTTATVYIYN